MVNPFVKWPHCFLSCNRHQRLLFWDPESILSSPIVVRNLEGSDIRVLPFMNNLDHSSIEMLSYQYINSLDIDATASRMSYLYHIIAYTAKDIGGVLTSTMKNTVYNNVHCGLISYDKQLERVVTASTKYANTKFWVKRGYSSTLRKFTGIHFHNPRTFNPIA